MMDTMHALKQSLDTGASTQGRIRIGAMDTVIHTWLSPLVARVTETFPAVEIELMADTARNLSEQLQKGYLDLIFQTDSLRHESVLNLNWAATRCAGSSPPARSTTATTPRWRTWRGSG